MSKTREVKILTRRREVCVVSFTDDDGKKKAVVAPSKFVEGVEGDLTNIDAKLLDQFPEHGIDWDIVFPDGIYIKGHEIGNMLHDRGVLTVQDLRENPGAFHEVMNQLTRSMAVKANRKVKEILGG